MKQFWENDNNISEFLNTLNEPAPCGSLADCDILDAIYRGEIYISPFCAENLTAAGYNLQISDVIISTKSGLPLKIFSKGTLRYVEVSANDTVLITTLESVFVGAQIMGTFHSRVSMVSRGFGHISTTLDPTWCGPLLIAVNNPSKQKKKIVISDSNGRHSFATLVFSRLVHPAEAKNTKPPIRTDVLGEFLQEPRGIKKLLIGKAYLQYEQLVKKLKRSGIYEDSGLKDPRENINLIEQLLIDIKAQYAAATVSTNIIVLSKLDSIFIQQDIATDLPQLCLDMLKILQSAFDYREELTTEDKSFAEKIIRYINICLIQLRREQQAYHWTQTNMECSSIAQKEALSNIWMRAVLGIPWRRVVKHFVWTVGIILVFILLLTRKERYTEFIIKLCKNEATVELIWQGTLSALAATFALIVRDLFEGDSK